MFKDFIKGPGTFVRWGKFLEEIYGLSFFSNLFLKSISCFDFIIGERRIWIKFVMQFDPDVWSLENIVALEVKFNRIKLRSLSHILLL